MRKKILIGISAILLLCLLLFALQALLIPKYATNSEGLLTGQYYDSSLSHDVVVVGDCEVYESIIPSVLWEKYGIRSYVRGGAQQLAWHSYYLLEETFKYESPKVVLFNVYALKYGTPQSEAYNRMTFDTMKWSSAKWNGILDSMTDDESLIDYIFPILRYHSRITDLKKEDLEYWFSTPESMTDNGYLIKTGVIPMPESDPIETPPEQPLPEHSMEYLEKMRMLCEENGSEFVLIKAPTNPRGYWWYDEWEEQIKEYSNEKKVAYYNFIPLADEIGIDWQTDTYDGGLHLNVYGAEKYTEYLGKILSQNHGLTSAKNDTACASTWNAYLEEYKNKKKQMEDSK